MSVAFSGIVSLEMEFACNNTMSNATNECPSVLLFGMQQRGKVVDELMYSSSVNGTFATRLA